MLFVVPCGNLELSALPVDARDHYPNYLLTDSARLLDPATALNALTVGGLVKYEATRNAQLYPQTIEDQPLARSGQPFTLTRCGPSINGAIKPDVVEHAGNLAIMRADRRTRYDGLGVVSLNGEFAKGSLFSEDIGTSYAAPAIAHKAARLLAELPDASPHLLRALIGAHAYWPKASEDLLNPKKDKEGQGKLLNLLGDGSVDNTALFRSLDNTVTLLAEEKISNDQHHFFELPLPESYWAGRQRVREISIALAYTPIVRTTRLDYRMSKLWFTLVTATNLNTVTESFHRNREQGMSEHSNGRWLSNKIRKNSTLQVSRWRFKRPLTNNNNVFIVITRQDNPWSSIKDQEEPYALTVVIADREQANARLYAEIRTTLEARTQARARIRL